MSLRSKTAVALCAVVAVLVSALAIVFARSSLSELRSIEEMNLADDAERTRRQIDTLLAGLSQTTADWAYWDESHQFVLDGNEDFTEENLSSEALGLISVDLAAFVRPRARSATASGRSTRRAARSPRRFKQLCNQAVGSPPCRLTSGTIRRAVAAWWVSNSSANE